MIVFLLLAAAVPTWANVYASSLVKTGDSTFTYVLNEAADTNVQIQVWKVGGSQVYSEDLGAQTAGTHSWTWNGNGSEPSQTYTIKVVASSAGHSAWTQIVADQTSTNFEHPFGVSIYTMQNSAKFGTIYVSNSRAT